MKKSLLLTFVLGILLLGCLEQAPASELIKVTVIINNGSAAQGSVINVASGTTAFDAFKQVANLSVKQYSFGVLVTGINGLEQDVASNKYWQYYVNGVLAPVGVDSLRLNESCTLEFRYETPPEFK